MALDQFGRTIRYLRISLTDHCNLRCVYCMPEDMTFRPNAELLQDDEILTLMELFARLGFDKYRLTGGEPTVRAHVVDLVRNMKQIPEVRSLSMTTNGCCSRSWPARSRRPGWSGSTSRWTRSTRSASAA